VFCGEDGRWQGVYIDLIEAIAADRGWTLEYVPGTFAECLERLADGRIDAQVSIAHSPERARRYDFNHETVLINWGRLYTHKDVEAKTILDLAGRRIAVLRGDIYYQAIQQEARQFGIRCEFVEVGTYADVLRAVDARQAEAGVVNRFYAASHEDEYASIARSPILVSPTQVRFAFTRGEHGDVIAALDASLAAMKADPSSVYHRSIERWLGEAPEHRLPVWLWYALGGAGAFALLFVALSVMLRRQVRARTRELSAKNEALESEIVRRTVTERARRRSEELFRNLLQNVPGVAIQGYETDGTVRYWNRESEAVYGYTAEEALGRNLGDLIIPPEIRPLFEKALKIGAAATESGEFMPGGEYELLRKDGGKAPVYSKHTAVCLEGSPPLLFCIDVDLSERRKAEEALRQSEERFSKAFQASPIGIGISEFDTGRFIDVNDALLAILECGREEIVGRTSVNLGVWSAKERSRAVAPLAKGAVKCEFEASLKAISGRMHDALVLLQVIDLNGRKCVLSLIQEITQRKEAERALRASEQRFRELAELLPEIVIETGPDGRLTFVNLNALVVTGYTAEDLEQGLNAIELLTPGDQPRARADLTALLGGLDKSPYAYTAVRKDGTPFPVHVYASPMSRNGEATGLRAIVVDVTEQQRAEQALRESEERFREIYEHSLVGIYRTTPNGQVLMANPALLRMLRYDSFEELSYLNLEKEGYAPGYSRADFRQRIESEEGLTGYESAWKRRDGSILYVRETGRCVRDEQGNPLYYEGTVEDITARRQAEEALRRQRDFNMNLIQTSPAFFVAISPKGKTLLMNHTMLTALGYSSEEVEGTDYLTKFVPPEDRDGLAEVFEALVTSKKGASHVNHLLRRDGRRLLIEWHGRQVMRDDGRVDYFFGVGMDITERQRIEEELRQAQKMEAIGRLTGGIAHDFNNQLTVIKGYCDLMLKSCPAGNTFREPLQQIQRASVRAANLTSQLLAYSRKQLLRPHVLDLNEVIAEMTEPLRQLLGEDIRLEVRRQATGQVMADPVQVHQAIMNLATNARDAMSSGGRFRIRTSDADVRRPRQGLSPGEYVLLTVRDTGAGMEPDVLEQIFEPFFTTKEVGKGTGLGLSMVYGFVRQSGGRIMAESTPGKGTTFRIYLPRLAPDEPPEAPAGSEKENSPVAP